jgi:hypothetical protein
LYIIIIYKQDSTVGRNIWMGHCFTVQQAEPRIGSRLEKEFEPMMKLGTIQDMEGMKLNKSDFIIEHDRNSKLTEYYQMDDSAKVLG